LNIQEDEYKKVLFFFEVMRECSAKSCVLCLS